MTPTQTDYEASDEAVRLLFDGSIKGADLRETIVKHIASFRLAAEAAAFEKAAGVADGHAAQGMSSLSKWKAEEIARDIRKLAGEKPDAQS